jgi:hypothetical protein
MWLNEIAKCHRGDRIDKAKNRLNEPDDSSSLLRRLQAGAREQNIYAEDDDFDLRFGQKQF